MRIVLFLLIMIPSICFAQITKDICKTFNDEFLDINSQLPMQVDYATKLIGLNAMFTNNTCFIHYEYLVNENIFLRNMVKSLSKSNVKTSEQELIALYQSNKGHSKLQNEMKRMQLKRLHGNNGMNDFLKYNGVISVTTVFSGVVPNISFEIIKD